MGDKGSLEALIANRCGYQGPLREANVVDIND